LISFSGNFLLKLVAVFSTIIVLRYLSVYEYGLWQLALGILSLFSALTLPSISDVFVADLSRELGRRREDIYKAIFRQISLLMIGLGFLSATFLFFIAPLITEISGFSFTFILRLLSLYLIFYAIGGIYSTAFYSRLKFFQYQSFKVANRLIYLLLVLLLVVYFDLGLVGVVYAYTFSSLILLIIFMPSFIDVLRYSEGVSPDFHYSLWSMFRAHGKWAVVRDYAEGGLFSARPWIIGYFLGVEAVALVSLAFALFGELMTVIPLNQVLAPIIPREVEDKFRFKKLIEKGIKYTMWLYLGMGIAAYFAMPYFVELFFPKYLPALTLFNILLLSIPAVPFLLMTERVFYAVKAQKELFISTIFPKVGGLFLILPPLLKLFGIFGTVYEFIVSNLLIAFTRMRYIKAVSGLSVKVSPVELFRFDAEDKLLLNRIISNIKIFKR
jgi:O-antigen/teichoic acid export membrane protein